MRISWDEATDLIAAEIRRIHKEYGPLAILVQGDGHGECKFIHAPHGCSTLLLDKMGGFTQQVRNPDSWEGWYWGSRHIWGKGLVGMMNPADNIVNDISQNSDMVVVWGGDPETTPWGFRGQLASRLLFFWNEIGLKQVYICPDVNYAAAIHADKWIPILPNTDAALQLAIIYMWINEGTYDKEYVDDPHRRLRQDRRPTCMGEEDGVPKTPAVGLAQVRRAGVDHQGPGPRLGQEDRHHRPLLRRRHGPRPVLARAGPARDHPARHAGPGQAGRPPVADRLPGHAPQHPRRRPAVHGHVQQPGRRRRSATGCSSRTGARRRPGASSSSPRPSSRRPSTVRRSTSGAPAATRSRPPTSTRSTPIPSRRRRAAPSST